VCDFSANVSRTEMSNCSTLAMTSWVSDEADHYRRNGGSIPAITLRWTVRKPANEFDTSGKSPAYRQHRKN
jgi:hypothetical protein